MKRLTNMNYFDTFWNYKLYILVRKKYSKMVMVRALATSGISGFVGCAKELGIYPEENRKLLGLLVKVLV